MSVKTKEISVDDLRHNQRFSCITMVINASVGRYTFHIRDVIIWRMDEETIDVTKYGDNLSVTVLFIEDILSMSYKEETTRLTIVLK